MNLFERIAKGLGYTKANQPMPGWLLAGAGSEKFRIPDGSLWESQARLYQQLSWVQIAVSKVAKSCATTAFGVSKLVEEEREAIINHPFELLLNKPNPLMSRFELLEATFAYRSITGNAYWWLNKLSEDQEPEELWIIPPHKIKPVPDDKLYLKGYLYEPGMGNPVALEPWEIAHFKEFHPLSPFVGLSPIEAIAVVATGDLKMQAWNTKLFAENNARLPGILAFADPIGKAEWEQIKQDTRDKANKRELMMLRNAGKGGVEWMQAGISQKDMEFMAGRKFTKEEIFGIFAPGLASVLDVNATEANAIAGRSTLKELGLWPVLVAVAEKISNDILPSYGDNLVGEFEDVRHIDRALALQEQQEYAKTHSIDEIRTKYYSDEELGDERGEMLPIQIGSAPVTVGEMLVSDLFKPSDEPSVEEQPTEPVVVDGDDTPDNIESTAGLNGAQITAAVGLLDGVAKASIAPTVAIELLIAVGLDRARAEKMVADTIAFAGEKPAPVEEVAEEEIVNELDKWQRKAERRMQRGDVKVCDFQSDIIPVALRATILSMLAEAKSVGDVGAVFKAIKSERLEQYGDFAPLVAALTDATLAMRETV